MKNWRAVTCIALVALFGMACGKKNGGGGGAGAGPVATNTVSTPISERNCMNGNFQQVGFNQWVDRNAVTVPCTNQILPAGAYGPQGRFWDPNMYGNQWNSWFGHHILPVNNGGCGQAGFVLGYLSTNQSYCFLQNSTAYHYFLNNGFMAQRPWWSGGGNWGNQFGFRHW